MRTVGAVVIRLETSASPAAPCSGIRKFSSSRPLVPVLNPQYAVLVFIESGIRTHIKSSPSAFTLAGQQILFGKDSARRRCISWRRRGVNKAPALPPAYPAERWRRAAVFQQIIHRTAATPRPLG